MLPTALAKLIALTLVVAGGLDILTPARLGRAVAEAIPGAQFVLLPEEAHQPFQERPEESTPWSTRSGRTV